MKAKLSYWLSAALCVTAILVSSSTGWAQEAAEEKKADAAEGQDTEADPYAIPEGGVEELVGFVKKIQRMRPKSRAEYAEMMKKQPPAISEAVDKLLALNPSAEDAAMAVRAKAMALMTLRHTGPPEAEAELFEFLAKMKKDERKPVVSVATIFDLQERAIKWKQLDDEKKDRLLDEFLAFLGSEKIGGPHIQMIRLVLMPVEREKDYQRASDAYGALIPIFRAIEDPNMAKQADLYEGTVRRLNLVGNPMELKGKLLDGTELDWKAYRGKVVLVDYWATWCGPCIGEIPNVVENYEKYREKGFEVIGISLDQDREKLESFVKDRNIPWPIMHNFDKDAGLVFPMAKQYGVSLIPTAILVDKDGNGVTLEARGEELGKQLKALLGEPAEAKASEEKDEAQGDS